MYDNGHIMFVSFVIISLKRVSYKKKVNITTTAAANNNSTTKRRAKLVVIFLINAAFMLL